MIKHQKAKMETKMNPDGTIKSIATGNIPASHFLGSGDTRLFEFNQYYTPLYELLEKMHEEILKTFGEGTIVTTELKYRMGRKD